MYFNVLVSFPLLINVIYIKWSDVLLAYLWVSVYIYHGSNGVTCAQSPGENNRRQVSSRFQGFKVLLSFWPLGAM